MAHTNMDAGRNSREVNMATNIELLRALMALNRGDLPPLPRPATSAPIPYAPVPDLGPLSTETTAAYGALNPEPVPPRFIQPTLPDASLINQEVGPAPTAPAPLSRAQRIFNAIGGFGAGVQGQGAQYLAQLQEPQREYQRQLERYQVRRTEALDRAERRAEREAAQAQRVAEMQYERDYKTWLKKQDIRADEATERTRQAFTLQRDAQENAQRIAAAERKERADREEQRNKIYADLVKSPTYAPVRVANEIADNIVHGKPMSASTEKWRSMQVRKAEAQLAKLGAGGGGSGAASRRETLDLQKRTAQAAAGIDAMEKLARQAMESPEAERTPILGQMRAKAATLQAQFPDLLETGEHNGWAFARLRQRGAQVSPAAQPAAQAVEISKADVQEFMRLSGIKNAKEARRQLEAAGGIVK